MSKSVVSILNFKILYNILFELKDVINFKIINHDSESDLIENTEQANHIIITDKTSYNEKLNLKNIIILNNLPIKILDLIDIINTNLLKEKYSLQSNLSIKKYKLDVNSRTISYDGKELKLTEREIEIILFLNNKKKPQKINILQSEVWGYSENLETHTVETHVYRLRKKINEKFNDENFLVSSKDGYKI